VNYAGLHTERVVGRLRAAREAKERASTAVHPEDAITGALRSTCGAGAFGGTPALSWGVDARHPRQIMSLVAGRK
jgi:hypothetical protein